jgi:YhcH/YjgK/YiaL family protein
MPKRRGLMIFDRIENLGNYTNIGNLKEILEFIDSNNLEDLPEGDSPIKGAELFVRVLRYTPKEADENSFETHRYYTDVQMVIRGSERMQVTSTESLRAKGEYDSAGDFQFFDSDGDVSDFVVNEGQFAVFFSGEPHKPGCLHNADNISVTKVVFKTR